MLRVLGLCSYPVESASTRFRMVQYVEPLRARGIELEVSPFLTGPQFAELYKSSSLLGKASGLTRSLLRRVRQIPSVRGYDAIFVQREAAIIGPPVFEKLYRRIANAPLLLDLDDATFVAYRSPTYGWLGNYLKFFGKTDDLIAMADMVICGNRFIADYANAKGSESVVVPTVVDTGIFTPVERTNNVPVIGWVGTHSTYPFLKWLFPVLQRLRSKHSFALHIVGAGEDTVRVEGIETVSYPWRLDREVADFQALDIGLYPMTLTDSANNEWLQGKSGFKAIQYMAVGVPFVMSPIGVAAELGIPGKTHFNAVTIDDWYTCLDQLLSDSELRVMMGRAARQYSLENFTVDKQADLMADIFKAQLAK